MPRIPYKTANPTEPSDLVEAIRKRRGGNLLNLDRMLLQSPSFAKGWNAFLGEVRTALALSPKLRELAICAVAVLNDADYEFQQHAPEFIKAGGTAQQVEALQRIGTYHDEFSLFDRVERATLMLTSEMTRNVKVKDTTFANIRVVLPNDQHVVELVGVIATYNMVSRFLVALEVEQE
ncbi:MAG TPA: carboxymuconolactone decarboxylase family protein [Burkholderiaceae bacterium]|jgi:alkylhydroperoxidase family enzyme